MGSLSNDIILALINKPTPELHLQVFDRIEWSLATLESKFQAKLHKLPKIKVVYDLKGLTAGYARYADNTIRSTQASCDTG